MLNINHTMKPDFYQYEEYLNEGLEVYIDPQVVQRKLEYLRGQGVTHRRNIAEYMWVASGGKIKYYDKESFLDFLEYHVNVEPYFLKDRKTGKRSISKENVIKPIYKHYPSLQDFLDMYMRSTEIAVDINKLQKILNTFSRDTELVNQEEKPLKAISFIYEQVATGRYTTKNDAVQNYSKRYTDILTVPKDYCLYWADFHQIDLRVAYQTILSEDNSVLKSIFRDTDDKYEAMARIMAEQTDTGFNLDEFRSKRDLYKVGVLARTYGQSASQIARDTGDSAFANNLNRYFVENEKYNKYLQALYDVMQNSTNFEIKDYFGVTRPFTVVSHQPSILNSALNAPIQSTSNSIVVHFTNAVISRFRELGFGSDKFKLYLNRHDEVVFQMHKSCMKYMYIIEQMSNVQVDDWAVLTMEHHVGTSYGVETPSLMEYFYKNVIDNKHLAGERQAHTPREDYLPVNPLQKYTFDIQSNRIIAVKKDMNRELVIAYERTLPYKLETQEDIAALEKEFSYHIIEMNKDICQHFNFQTEEYHDAKYLPEIDAYVHWDSEKTGDYYSLKRDIQKEFADTEV